MKWRASVLRTKEMRGRTGGDFVIEQQVVEADTRGLAINEAFKVLKSATINNLSIEPIADETTTVQTQTEHVTTVPASSTGVAVADCIVYDVESKLCIPNDREPRHADWQYCNGEGDWLGMGISCICAIDTRDMVTRIFLDDNFDAFCKLIEGRCVAGHSNHEFDDKIVTAHGATVARSFDLLRHVRVAMGEPPYFVPRTTRGGRKVNDFARVNLDGMQKSGDGALAPVLYQRGKIGELVDYCTRDVTIETRLILKLPHIIDPLSHTRLNITPPR